MKIVLSIMLMVSTFLSMAIVSCAARRIPIYSHPIFTLDNKDPHNILLRYKGTETVIRADSELAKGAVVFLPEDFVEWNRTYIQGCLSYDQSLPSIESSIPSEPKATAP